MKQAALLLALLLLVTAFAACDSAAPETPTEAPTEDEYEFEYDYIDVDALKAIEAKDTFGVRITKKEVVKDAFSGFNLEGSDALNLTLTNSTGASVKDITVIVIGYLDHNGQKAAVSIGDGFSWGQSGYERAFITNEIVIDDGASEAVAVKCRADSFTGAQAIVASYVDADGSEIRNPIVDEWYNALIASMH